MNRIRKIKFEGDVLWGSIAVGFTVLILLAVLIHTGDVSRFNQVLAGGLYQAMLIFMVAAGLSIVFGLMDVLNFAQGSLLMIGAYVGLDVLTHLSVTDDTNALLLSVHVVTLTPIVVAILLEIVERYVTPHILPSKAAIDPETGQENRNFRQSTLLQKIGLAVVIGAPLGYLLGETITDELTTQASVLRIIAANIVVLLMVFDMPRDVILFGLKWVVNEVKFRFLRGLAFILNGRLPTFDKVKPVAIRGINAHEVVLMIVGLNFGGALAVLFGNVDTVILQLGLAGIAAIFAGTVAGIIMETVFIRPTYSRPFFQIVLTFGIALVIREAIIYRYGSVTQGTLNPYLTPALRGTFPPEFLQGLLPNLETTIFNYWIFMIVMGVLMMVGVQLLLMRTRIGIIIRAGVQDSEMVEALGVNVRLVFTGVFTLGAAIAALGGVISGGFIAIDPLLGDLFLLQAIAVVIIGGLGSYMGTALAAIVVGITRQVAAYFSREQFNTDGFAPLAVLFLLCLTLIVKPSGLFGKDH
jgi:branched-chain amino acid transport system permease protein